MSRSGSGVQRRHQRQPSGDGFSVHLQLSGSIGEKGGNGRRLRWHLHRSELKYILLLKARQGARVASYGSERLKTNYAVKHEVAPRKRGGRMKFAPSLVNLFFNACLKIKTHLVFHETA